jgi:hypothetical protein
MALIRTTGSPLAIIGEYYNLKQIACAALGDLGDILNPANLGIRNQPRNQPRDYALQCHLGILNGQVHQMQQQVR